MGDEDSLYERLERVAFDAAEKIDMLENRIELDRQQINELETKRDDDRREIELLRKYLDECENRGVIDYVNTLALDQVAAAAALLLGTAAATASAVV